MAVKQEKQDERAAVNQKAEKLLKDYGNSILRMAYAYLHNMSDAEDILQETLIQYLQTAPVLENPAHEKAWLLKVAANLSKNRIDYNRIRLFHHEGYSTAQIAKILEYKEATVRTNLRRGRQQLKEILKEEYDFGEV